MSRTKTSLMTKLERFRNSLYLEQQLPIYDQKRKVVNSKNKEDQPTMETDDGSKPKQTNAAKKIKIEKVEDEIQKEIIAILPPEIKQKKEIIQNLLKQSEPEIENEAEVIVNGQIQSDIPFEKQKIPETEKAFILKTEQLESIIFYIYLHEFSISSHRSFRI